MMLSSANSYLVLIQITIRVRIGSLNDIFLIRVHIKFRNFCAVYTLPLNNELLFVSTFIQIGDWPNQIQNGGKYNCIHPPIRLLRISQKQLKES
jgi:hypothetical protein